MSFFDLGKGPIKTTKMLNSFGNKRRIPDRKKIMKLNVAIENIIIKIDVILLVFQ